MDSDSAFFFGAPLNLHVWISCSINQKQKPESVSTNLTTDAFQFCPLCQLLTKQRGIGALWRFCFHAYQTTKNYFCIPSCLSSCRQQVNPFTYLAVEAGVFFLFFFARTGSVFMHKHFSKTLQEFWQPLMHFRIFGVLLLKNFRQGFSACCRLLSVRWHNGNALEGKWWPSRPCTFYDGMLKWVAQLLNANATKKAPIKEKH